MLKTVPFIGSCERTGAYETPGEEFLSIEIVRISNGSLRSMIGALCHSGLESAWNGQIVCHFEIYELLRKEERFLVHDKVLLRIAKRGGQIRNEPKNSTIV